MTDTLLKAARQIVSPGDTTVMVCYPLNEKTNNPAHALDGQEFIVKSRHRVGKDAKGGDRYLYELYGAESKEGVPYSFLTDELIRI